VDALFGQFDDSADGVAATLTRAGAIMTIALWRVLSAGLLPHVATVIAKAGVDFDNRDPRAWPAQQQGYRRRANAASMHAFEALPLFAAAVLIAHVLRGPQQRQGTRHALRVRIVRDQRLGCGRGVAAFTGSRPLRPA
jgi:uncharacterized MAPEG superfamily protein